MSWFELVGKHPQISEGCVYDKKQTAKKWRWMAFSLPQNTKTCTTGKETRSPLKPTGRTPTGFQRCSHITGGSLWMAESNRFHGNTCSKNQLPPLQRLNHLKALQPEREREIQKVREHLISSPDGKTLYQALLSRPLPVQKTPSSSVQTQSQHRLYLVLTGYTLSPWYLCRWVKLCSSWYYPQL